MRGRHLRRRLAWPWPEWLAWLVVAAIWATSSGTVWLVMSSVTFTVSSEGEYVRFTGEWVWPWDR